MFTVPSLSCVAWNAFHPSAWLTAPLYLPSTEEQNTFPASTGFFTLLHSMYTKSNFSFEKLKVSPKYSYKLGAPTRTLKSAWKFPPHSHGSSLVIVLGTPNNISKGAWDYPGNIPGSSQQPFCNSTDAPSQTRWVLPTSLSGSDGSSH
ncbi:hypothetical protein B0H14DRAFT_2571786 [Mycena olivaceomarginata]|nr:hypothetical protein B0H14DRAFT_2571786 [Mycena olivaceomarginata]